MRMQSFLREDEVSWRNWLTSMNPNGIPSIRIENTDTMKVTELPHDMPDRVIQLGIIETDITSLHGCTQICDAATVSRNKKLKSLLGGPQNIKTYHCYNNALESLQGAPEECTTFSCHNNKLKSFMHAPKHVSIAFMGQKNPVATLHGIGVDYLRYVGGSLELTDLPITSHALGLLMITGTPWIKANFLGFDIISKFMDMADNEKKDRRDYVIDCQHALIEDGYEDLAQL